MEGGYRVQTSQGSVETRCVLNAAGLYAEEIHAMIAERTFETRPSRGEYYLLDKSEGTRVRHVIFQCPTASGKGVLVAPTAHGNLIVGPTSDRPENCDDVSNTADGLRRAMETARKSVPNIDFRASIRNFAGNRALTDRDDFIIEEAEGARGFIDIAGIKSPGLSAAPAIAKMAVALLAESGLMLQEKQDFCGTRRRVRFHELTAAEKAALVAEDPAYGRVICRCEGITEGEIVEAIRRPVGPRSLDAIKRRCGAGLGRCQSGFCGPRVLDILAREWGIDPTEIPQDRAGSFLLTGRTKA